MLEIRAQFDKLRAVVGQKEPLVLEVIIKNIGEKPQTVTTVIKIPFSLGFDKIGLEREKRIRVGEIKPKEAKQVVVAVLLKAGTKESIIPVEVKAIEHPNDRYDKALEMFETKANLRVIKA